MTEMRFARGVSNNKSLLVLLEVALGVMLLITACGSDETPTPSISIQGIVWQWESVINQSTGEATDVPNPENYTITFNDDNTFNGMADCNAIAGTFSQEAGFSITVGPSTMAFCGEESLDQQYVSLLGSVAAGGPDGAGGLALETAGGEQRMVFSTGGAATN